MDLKKLQALYGLKWDPFAPEVPVEGLLATSAIDQFCFRVENLALDGGFALLAGEPGTGKSAHLRLLTERLGKIPELVVAEFERPQGGVTDFYRELGSLFGIPLTGIVQLAAVLARSHASGFPRRRHRGVATTAWRCCAPTRTNTG